MVEREKVLNYCHSLLYGSGSDDNVADDDQVILEFQNAISQLNSIPDKDDKIYNFLIECYGKLQVI